MSGIPQAKEGEPDKAVPKRFVPTRPNEYTHAILPILMTIGAGLILLVGGCSSPTPPAPNTPEITATEVPQITSPPTETQAPTPTFTPSLTDSPVPTDTPTPTKTATPTTTPTPTQTALLTNLIVLTGTTDTEYDAVIPNNTLIDATNWTSVAIGPEPDGTTGRAADLYGTNPDGGGMYIVWRGGVIIGSIPRSWDWRTTHDFGGGGIFLRNDGPIEWQYLRIHNVEDGIKPREAPEYSNTGTWVLRDCYFTAIRDDAIENDRFEPGTVQDCLFDGVYVFLSEQDENVNENIPIGPDEVDTIYVRRVFVRLYGTNDAEGPGKWFKWLGNVPHHKVEVSDSVFAIGSEPRLGWKDENIPPEISWVGDNNFILWLGAPGAYGGPKPAGVRFLEGDAAQEKWITVRNGWLSDHGLPPQDFPADYDPYKAPLEKIPAGP